MRLREQTDENRRSAMSVGSGVRFVPQETQPMEEGIRLGAEP